MMKECKDFCDRLSDYLDGQVDENICILIGEHLEVCPPCALMYESLKTTVEICNRGISDDLPEEVGRRLKIFLRIHCNKEQT